MITDLTPYRRHVDQFDLTEKQKLDLVNAVWAIVDSIYDQHLGKTIASESRTDKQLKYRRFNSRRKIQQK